MRTSLKAMVFLLLTSLSPKHSIFDVFCLRNVDAQEQNAAKKLPISPKKNRTVIDMTADELRRSYGTELRGIEFIQSQEELTPLLTKMGERVQAFFRDFSNTSSKEEVLLKRLGYGDRMEATMIRTYNYLILFRPDNSLPLLEEYRTDKKFDPIDQEALTGFYISSGYSCLSVLVHPKYLQDSNFRYLGRQSAEPRAHIIAFAQKPECGRNLVKFTDTDANRSIRVPLQGFVWVDPNTNQIFRIQTSLSTATIPSFAATQTTDIQFSEIGFESITQKLWLPLEVNVQTRIAGKTYRNLHRYSNYKLFGSATDIKFAKPESGEFIN